MKCACGCGEEIVIKKTHRKNRMPKYILGHWIKVNAKSGESSPFWKGGRSEARKRTYLKDKQKAIERNRKRRKLNPDLRKIEVIKRVEKYGKDELNRRLREYWAKNKEKKRNIDKNYHERNRDSTNAKSFFNYYGIKFNVSNKELVLLYKSYKNAEKELKNESRLH